MILLPSDPCPNFTAIQPAQVQGSSFTQDEPEFQDPHAFHNPTYGMATEPDADALETSYMGMGTLENATEGSYVMLFFCRGRCL